MAQDPSRDCFARPDEQPSPIYPINITTDPMKTAIKILLIVLALAGIGYAVYSFFDKTEKGEAPPPPQSDFEKEILAETERGIKDRDYARATAAFAELCDRIDTEASVTLADGSRNLSADEVRRARQIVFYAYVPIFTAHADACFARTAWSDDEVATLGATATRLEEMRVAEAGSPTTKDLARIRQTAADYRAAWQAARSGAGCHSVAAVRSVISRANSFKRKPLSNCTALVSALGAVPARAKNGLATYIAARCNHVASSYASYSSYVDFYGAQSQCLNLIDEYEKAFGGNAALTSARRRLQNAETLALDQLP